MDIFPTQNSTLSAVALKTHLAQSYGLIIESCKLLVRNVSDTYLIVATDTKYIFKIYLNKHRKFEEICAEVELLNELYANGAKVAYPLTAVDGTQIQAFNAAEGTRYGVLFSYAKGVVVHDLQPDQLKALGREMASVHNITSKIILKNPRRFYNNDTMLLEPIKLVKPAFESIESEYNYLKETSEEIAKKINQLDLAKFSYGYCHYDFLPKNFHFEGNNVTFFDFDFAGQGYLINDIASFYIHYFLEVYYGKITQEEADLAFAIFVKAYREVRSLSEAELATIPYFGYAFWIFYMGFHYENFDDWSNIFFGPKFLKDRTTLIKKWVDWYVK
jgi:Ser/Thr protein kinase RdoA (MazF antagonist)